MTTTKYICLTYIYLYKSARVSVKNKFFYYYIFKTLLNNNNLNSNPYQIRKRIYIIIYLKLF